MNAAQVVDLDRYPIHEIEGSIDRDLVAGCRDALHERALCRLPGFVRSEVVRALADEAAGLEDVALSYAARRIAYDDRDDALPDSHLRNRRYLCRYRQVLNHQISNDSALRQLYQWPPLTEFIRRVLGIDTLYPSTCPHLALTLQLARAGDTNGWHFDGNDFVVSLLLQEPDSGGEFEYAPYVRTAEDERYDRIAAVVDDPDRNAERPRIEAGTFTLFKGDLSLHRVRPIGETEKPRIIALFSYDENPGHVFPQDYIDELRGSVG